MNSKGVVDNILEARGFTPLVRVANLASHLKPNILMKLENLNPSGAGNDRIAVKMIRDAEEKGMLKSGSTIIEATNGNTGISLAMCGAVMGYHVIVTVPDKISREKTAMLKAYGAKVIVTPSAVAPTDPRSYISVAKRLASEMPQSYFINHCYNTCNPEAHYETTGPEIWDQTGGKIDAFIVGLGSGGTITGVGKYLKEKNEKIKIIGVDPEGSVYSEYFRNQNVTEAQFYHVEEIGRDLYPTSLDYELIDKIYTVSDRDCFNMARLLCKSEGILVGGSAGAVIWAALQEATTMEKGQTIVTLICESGDRYLSKIYSDNWMAENQFLEEDVSNTALEILMKKKTPMDHCVTISPDTTASEAMKVMRRYEISQLPVVEEGEVLGTVTEGPIIDLVIGKKDLDAIKSREIMDESLPILELSTNIERISALLASGNHAVLVRMGEWNFGIITKFDLIH
jgi:cystathionine beta-synthase